MLVEGTVNDIGNISFSDGDDVKLLTGKTRELVTSPLHDFYYTLNARKKLFHGYSTTSATIPITSTTSPTFILWNPKSSNINIVLVSYSIGYESGTNAEGNVMLGVMPDAGARQATGAPITAFTPGPVLMGCMCPNTTPIAKFGVAATLTSATTYFLPLGISLMQLKATASAPVVIKEEFKGTVILQPGSAVFSCASAATVAKYHERIVWYEFPI